MVYKVIGFLVISIGLIVAGVWVEYRNVLSEPVITKQTVIFDITKGDSFNRISDNLVKSGVEINPLWFKVIARINEVADKLKAGEYVIEPGTTTPQLLSLFTAGKTRQYSITFPEGWAFKDMIKAIEEHPKIVKNIINKPAKEIMASLGSEYQHPEGLFFPDTYFFDKDTSDEALLKRAYLKMQQVLSKQWQQREAELPLESAYQALILASIVEKETGKASERPIIAGVFVRRLRKGMLLQTDPTVIYGMGARYQGNIRKRDLLEKTAYNTYVIKGLTPTPIAMPGKEAINAVMHPTKGSSLFFVARGDGSHVFSTTLKQHNRAVDIFQRKIKRK